MLDMTPPAFAGNPPGAGGPRPFIASSWCLVRPTKHRTLRRERGAGRRISVLYAQAFKHFEDLLIGDAATFAQLAHLGYGCV